MNTREVRQTVCVSRKPTCCINTVHHKQKSIVWSQIMIHTLYSLRPTRMFIERPGIQAGRGFHLPAKYCKLGTLPFGSWNSFKWHHTEPGVRQWPIFYKMGTNKRCRNNVALRYHSQQSVLVLEKRNFQISQKEKTCYHQQDLLLHTSDSSWDIFSFWDSL